MWKWKMAEDHVLSTNGCPTPMLVPECVLSTLFHELLNCFSLGAMGQTSRLLQTAPPPCGSFLIDQGFLGNLKN